MVVLCILPVFLQGNLFPFSHFYLYKFLELYLTDCVGRSITLCVTGFGPQLSEIRLLQALYKGLPWQMDDYFLAVSSPTGSNLGFVIFHRFEIWD